MNKISHFLRLVVTITTLLLSACGAQTAASTPNAEVQNAEPIPVAFIGMVDGIAGDQWVINGQTVTVTAAAIQDGPFNVGDQVKVEGVVNADGSFTVASVEVPTPQDVSSLPSFGDESPGAGNENSSNENSANENISNENGANENGNNENIGNENSANENSSNENEGIENESNENEGNENVSNENSSNENQSNENEENENESNQNGGGNENANNENGGGENGGND
jgi:Domain of unknown function (DUF5666)